MICYFYVEGHQMQFHYQWFIMEMKHYFKKQPIHSHFFCQWNAKKMADINDMVNQNEKNYHC